MKKELSKIHVLSSLIMNLLLISIIFSCDNPLVISGVLAIVFILLLLKNCRKEIIKGVIYFLPFAGMTVLINMIFVFEGGTTLFEILGRRFTLEALIYAILLAVKLLIVIYVFLLLRVMIDSDEAVVYFSSLIPKSTLLIMICIKLFPVMQERLSNLKNIYSIRGVNFEGKGLKNKVISFIPVLSVLLENSLEDSFDIGESAYVRGFLSGKRSMYKKPLFKKRDIALLFESMCILFFYITFSVKGYLVFDIYSKFSSVSILNYSSSIIVALLILLMVTCISGRNQ